jgi:hypothetical protein
MVISLLSLTLRLTVITLRCNILTAWWRDLIYWPLGSKYYGLRFDASQH